MKQISLPFLDALLNREKLGYLREISATVCRKGTFTGQYLNFTSVDPMLHKIAVFKTLIHTAKIYCSNAVLFNAEGEKYFFLTQNLILIPSVDLNVFFTAVFNFL